MFSSSNDAILRERERKKHLVALKEVHFGRRHKQNTVGERFKKNQLPNSADIYIFYVLKKKGFIRYPKLRKNTLLISHIFRLHIHKRKFEDVRIF